MTRPLGLLLATTLAAACIPGCAQLDAERDGSGSRRPFSPFSRVIRSKPNAFSTSLEENAAKESTPEKKDYLPATTEPSAPPMAVDLSPPPEEPKDITLAQGPATLPDLPPVRNIPVEPPSKKLPEGSPQPPTLVPPPTAPGEPVARVSEKLARPSQEPLVIALQCILENRHQEALEYLKKYDASTQELFMRLLPPLALLAQKKLEELGPADIYNLSFQLENLLSVLRPRAELMIDRACFCQWVRSFGNYAPLPDNHLFLASAPNRPGERVQLYVEVKNFGSENREGLFETRFGSTVEIHDSKGDKVWYYRFEDRQHPIRSRTLLHDYFNNYSFFVPHLPAGHYTLTIAITDETVTDRRREARKSLDFRVGSGTR
jgi:hypothetical protein